MADCQISDIRPLVNLTGLQSLHLDHNHIADITPLTNLTQLTDLWLTGNYIADVRPLENLTVLESLRIQNNVVRDYSPVETLPLVDFAYDEVCESAGLSIQKRIRNRGYPSIFKPWVGIFSRTSLSDKTPITHHALHWSPEFTLQFRRTDAGFELAGNLTDARKQRNALLQMNPNMIFILEIRMRDADPNSPFYRSAYNANFPWIRDTAGNKVSGSDKYTSFLIDFTHPDAQDIIVEQALAVKRCGFYDGIIFGGWDESGQVLNGYRTFEAEQQARAVILKRIRAEVGDDFLILVMGDKPMQAAPYINGIFLGGTPHRNDDSRYEVLMRRESTLLWAAAHLRSPQVTCLESWGVETQAPDSPTNRRWMRAFTTMGLTHSNGYVLYTVRMKNTPHEHDWNFFDRAHKEAHERGLSHTHRFDRYWYDFWDANLGTPIGEKGQRYRNREGLFIREFTNGWAVYNRSGQAQRIEFPETTTGVASGVKALLHTVPDLDGEIFLKTR